MRISLASRSASPRYARLRLTVLAALGALAAGTGVAVAGPEARLPVRPSNRAVTVEELIAEASRRFGVPAAWIADVMRVESGGRMSAVSPKGAIGLMQVMPDTYAGLASRYGLGADPWNVRDNVLAGAAYLREMYDRYGAAGMLAAYNAGPGRWEDYRLRARPLPDETVRYLARLGPVVGASVTPLPVFAGSAAPRSPYAAPIFVALATPPVAAQGAAERERIVRVIEANATVVGRPAAVFVPRSRAVEASPAEPEGGEAGAIDAPSTGTSAGRPAASTPSPNPLFAPRSSSGERP